MSLEGVLTGGALGLVLLYLFQEGAQAAGAPRPRGPVSLKGPFEFGPFQGGAGRIPIRPLAMGELELPRRRLDDAGSGGGSRFMGGIGGQGLRPRRELEDEPELELALSQALARRSPSPGPGPGPNPPPPPPPPPPPAPDPLPELVLVVVQSETAGTARSIWGTSSSRNQLRQVGIERSSITFSGSNEAAEELISVRRVPAAATSLFNDADLRLNAEHLGLLDSRIQAGDTTDLLVFRVDELLPLALLAAGRTEAEVEARAATLERTAINTADGDDLVALEALLNLRFFGLGESTDTELVFDLLTQGMKDSFLQLGPGTNTVTVNSGFYQSNQGLTLGELLGPGLDFDFNQSPALEPDAGWLFDLDARAVGLEDSSLSFGDDDDDLTVFTRIDEQLASQLGDRYSDPNTRINLERIGMLNSQIAMGAGNDRVRINGQILGSVIDLGEGNNTLLLEEELGEGSRIVMGQGANTVTINSMLGGVVEGGAGDDVFLFDDLLLAGQLDGGAGFNTLIGPGAAGGTRDVVTVNGRDQGFFNGLRFQSIQELDTGAGDDVAIMAFDTSLSGRLFGGDGLDRLEFLSWELPVVVDLDAGQATAIFAGQPGGINGFESATGGRADDWLAASGSFSGLLGAGGSDTFELRWSPWLAAAESGLEVVMNPLSDRLLLSGVNADPPSDWDGRYGLPVINELDLAELPGIEDQVLWAREEGLLRLTPSGAEGVGDVNLLPIAPLEQLLSGMASGGTTTQLAVNTSPLLLPGGSPAELILLGSSRPEGYHAVAQLPAAVFGIYNPNPSSGSTGLA